MVRRAALILVALFAFSMVLTVQAQEEPRKFRYDIVVTFLSSENWEIVARQGQQVAQKFHVTIYVSQPCRADIRITVGGETEYQASETIDFKWERDHTTQKSAQQLLIYVTFHFDKTEVDATWRGLIVKAPVPYPKNLEEWLSPKQVQRMLENITFEHIIKAIIFALIGVGLAIISRYYFLLLNPMNGIHASMLVATLIGYLAYDSQWGVGYWLITLLSDIVPNKNFDLVGIPYYTNPAGKLCAALQSSLFAVKRAIFGEHVEFRFRNEYLPEDKQEKILSITPTHTLNKVEPLYLADKANVTEFVEAVEEEEEAGGIIGFAKGLLKRRKERKKIYFDVYPSNIGIPFNNFELGFDAEAIKKLKQWAVNVAMENAELKQLLEAKSIQKGQQLAKRHLDELMKIIFPPQTSEGATTE